MTTTTLMETFDTQMLDSGDADMPMYLGTLTTDPWSTVETTMVDAADPANPGPSDHQPIEVDMDNRDEEMTEYEMADEEGHENEVDLVDVDVVDATIDSSSALVAIDETRIPLTGASPHPYGALLTSLSTPVMLEYDLGPAEATANLPGETGYAISSDAAASPATLETAALHASHSNQTDFSVAHGAETAFLGLPASSDLSDHAVVSAVQHENSNGDPVIQYGRDQPDVQSSEAREGAIESTEQASPLSEREIWDHANRVLEGEQSGDSFIGLGNGNADVAHDANHLSAPSEDATAPPVTNTTEQVTNLRDGLIAHSDLENREDQERGDEAVGAVDPHEISEGVYIDPPPAVLMSVSLSSEPVECCLFNQPASCSQSPSNHVSSSGHQVLSLLLHHRPTLYYEPLSAVFEALRQEEFIQEFLRFEDGELVLDAYDLQLVVSEDNAHTHEVTIHDLNVLHDGTDQFGPLRLQLRLSRRRGRRLVAL
ncbi:hypothetical protein BKA93DRAFT_416372 [Sparassis latifolia]